MQTLDGGGSQSGQVVVAGKVTVENMTIQNMTAVGGAGAGGAGVGAGLFVAGTDNNGRVAGPHVTLDNVTFVTREHRLGQTEIAS